MPAPQISPLPTPPSRSQSPDTFSTDADAFLGALPDFQEEANDQADYLDALAIAVDADATTASNAAAVAAGAANYQGDYSAGTTYQIGESVSYTGRRYVAKTVNTGVTPADGANWFLINDGDVLGPISATANGIALYDGTTGKIIKSGLNNGTAGQALISGGSGNAPVWGNVEGGVLPFTASGSITAGQPVSLRSDGTVEVATGFTQAETLGATNNYTAEQTTKRNAYSIVGTSDIVIFTRTSAGAQTAFHATVSGTTVTFNTQNAVPWTAPNNELIVACYDPVSGKYLVAWGDSGGIKAAVMTISGTSITFGTTVTVASGNFTGQAASITYDTLRQQLIVGYYGINNSSSNRIVGLVSVTISGTTPVVGHSRVVLDQLVNVVGLEVVYDSTVNRILYYHADTNNAYTLVRIVANTGTAFSTPSGFVTLSNFYAGYKSMTYDPTSGRWVLVGATAGSGGNAAVVSLSVAAETITASSVVTAVVGSTTINNSQFTRVAYDSRASRHVVTVYTQLNQVFYGVIDATSATPSFSAFTSIASGTRTPEVVYVTSQLRSVLLYYFDGASTGRAQTYQPAATATNTQNFIGISTQSVSDGQTVNVTITGGRNTNQTGLTTGANYFLNNDGALVTTGGVRVGEALSATSIFVEGKLAGAGTPSASTFLRGDGAFVTVASTVTLIASGTLSTNAASIIVNNLVPTGYSSIIIEFDYVGTTSNVFVRFQFLSPNGTTDGGNYYYNRNQGGSGGAGSSIGTVDSAIDLSIGGTSSAGDISAQIVAFKPADDSTTKRPFLYRAMGDQSNSVGQHIVGGGYNDKQIFGGFRLFCSSGNIRAGAKYRVYGVI